jgi:HEXXH motif-containing protein
VITVTSTHALSPQQRTELLSGAGDAAAVAALGAARLSLNLAMLRALLDLGREVPRIREVLARSGFLDSFTALSCVQDLSPSVVREILGYPYVGTWLAACLAAVRELRGAEDEGAARHLAHLGAVAIAAGAVAGVPVEAVVPVAGDRIALPGLGSVALDAGWDGRLVTARVALDGCLEVVGAAASQGIRLRLATGDSRWLPMRRLDLPHRGISRTVIVDDADPYRRQPGSDVHEPMPDDELSAWVASLQDAWGVLEERHPDQADAVAAGLLVLTPLRASGSAATTSATGRHAFGAVSLSRPADGIRGACGLVHEFQHTKLNGLSDVLRLLDSAPDSPSYSPWREDPRPLIGLLHGIYAWLAVTRFWAAETDARPAAPVAEFECARARRQLLLAVRTAQASGTWTSSGSLIVEAAERLATADDDEPIGRPGLLAEDVVLHHAVQWRLYHLTPDPDGVLALAQRWRAGQPADLRVSSALTPHARTEDGPETYVTRAVEALHKYPEGGGVQPGLVAVPAVTPELLLVAGDYPGAAAGYEADVTSANANAGAWAGLAVSRARLNGGRTSACAIRPELVRALFEHLEASDGNGASPAALNHWLSDLHVSPQASTYRPSGRPDSPDGFAPPW